MSTNLVPHLDCSVKSWSLQKTHPAWLRHGPHPTKMWHFTTLCSWCLSFLLITVTITLPTMFTRRRNSKRFIFVLSISTWSHQQFLKLFQNHFFRYNSFLLKHLYLKHLTTQWTKIFEICQTVFPPPLYEWDWSPFTSSVQMYRLTLYTADYKQLPLLSFTETIYKHWG